jgi:nucleoid-associated protein YgaU
MNSVVDWRWHVAVAVATALAALAPPMTAPRAAEPAQDAVRGYAEDLAQAASREFGAILERQQVAQAQQSTSASQAAAEQAGKASGGPLGWFQRSSWEFRALMQMLAGGPAPSRAWDPVADAERRPPSRSEAQQIEVRPQEPPPSKVTAAPAAETKQLADTKAAKSAKRPAEVKTAEDAKKAADDKRAAEEQAAIDAARAAEVKRAAAAKAAVDAANAAEAKRQRAKTAAEAKKAATAKTAAASPANRRKKASPATCKAAGRKARLPGWYVVKQGDTLSAIARRHYDRSGSYRRIRAANRRRIRNPHRIHACQRIYLPRLTRRR